MLYQRVEKDGGLAVFDQVLEVGVPAVLPDQGLARQILLEFLNLVLLQPCKQIEPSAGNQRCEPITLSLVGLDVRRLSDQDGHVFGGDNPLVSFGEEAHLCVLAVGLVESVEVDLGLVLQRQLLVAGEDVLDL